MILNKSDVNPEFYMFDCQEALYYNIVPQRNNSYIILLWCNLPSWTSDLPTPYQNFLDKRKDVLNKFRNFGYTAWESYTRHSDIYKITISE